MYKVAAGLLERGTELQTTKHVVPTAFFVRNELCLDLLERPGSVCLSTVRREDECGRCDLIVVSVLQSGRRNVGNEPCLRRSYNVDANTSGTAIHASSEQSSLAF